MVASGESVDILLCPHLLSPPLPVDPALSSTLIFTVDRREIFVFGASGIVHLGFHLVGI